MKFPPFFPSAAACLVTLALSQGLTPTVTAQPVSMPNYRVQMEWQKAIPSASGLVIRGRVTNTGSKPLTYTQVETVLCDGAGKTLYKAQGYLTVSPLPPGQSAEFRAFAPDAPAFSGLHVEFHEAGSLVRVDAAPAARPPSPQ